MFNSSPFRRLHAAVAVTALALAASVRVPRRRPDLVLADSPMPFRLSFLGIPFAPRIYPLSPRWRFPNSGRGPHQGAQEMARRRRQIERGTLTVSNGLVLPQSLRIAA